MLSHVFGFSDYHVIGPHYNPGVCCPADLSYSAAFRKGKDGLLLTGPAFLCLHLMPGDGEIDTWQVLVRGELGIVLKDLHM